MRRGSSRGRPRRRRGVTKGACAVLLDGERICSCLALAVKCAGWPREVCVTAERARPTSALSSARRPRATSCAAASSGVSTSRSPKRPRCDRLSSPGLARYHLPVHADVPPIDGCCLDDPAPATPLGVPRARDRHHRAAAAIANAVHRAAGRSVLDLLVIIDSSYDRSHRPAVNRSGFGGDFRTRRSESRSAGRNLHAPISSH